jgi:hypothetical protein
VTEERAMERMRLGKRIASELKKPTLSPSQRMPEQALSHADHQASKVSGMGRAKISPPRIWSMVLNEVTMIT